MGIQEKLRLALLQLKEYSDNELILVNGKSLNIQTELDNLNKTPCCPKCGSDKIRVTDHHCLNLPYKEEAEKYGYCLDGELYVNAECDGCESKFRWTAEVIHPVLTFDNIC